MFLNARPTPDLITGRAGASARKGATAPFQARRLHSLPSEGRVRVGWRSSRAMFKRVPTPALPHQGRESASRLARHRPEVPDRGFAASGNSGSDNVIPANAGTYSVTGKARMSGRPDWVPS